MAYLGMRFKETWAYRIEILMWVLKPMLQLILLATVWRAVYNGHSSMDGVPLVVMTTYVSLSAMHTLLMQDNMPDWVEERVRDGLIGADMLRPMSLLEQVVWGSVSQVIMKLVLLVFVIPVAAIFSGLTPPAAIGPYLVAALLGWMINTCLMMLMSAVVFWTLEMGGMTFLYYTISGFLSGALVPLWFMPGWLAGIIGALPFQATVYTPVAIYVGQIGGGAAWQAIGVQGIWLVLLAALVALVWRSAERRVVVQGG
jgi:ABC-type uncharacterized transport system permease subunit